MWGHCRLPLIGIKKTTGLTTTDTKPKPLKASFPKKNSQWKIISSYKDFISIC